MYMQAAGLGSIVPIPAPIPI